MRDELDREIRLALAKIHVLYHAQKHEVYGLWLLEELAEHGHKLSPGTLYPALARMVEHGWLVADEPASSRARRTFRISAQGRRVLAKLRRDVSELYRELVLGEEPDKPGSGRAASTRVRARRPYPPVRARGRGLRNGGHAR